MARNRVVLVSWGGNTVFSRTFPGDRYLAAGEGASADIPLPGTSFQIPPGYTGAFATGSFLIEVATTGDEDELRAPRWRPGVNGWSMFSAGAHVALLLAIALVASLRPTSVKDEEQARASARQGYMARIAEHDDELQGGVSSAGGAERAIAMHAGPSAAVSMETPFGEDGQGSGKGNDSSTGTGAQTSGRHLDDHNPSDAQLARMDGSDEGGAQSAAASMSGAGSSASTPSTLARALGPIKLADSKHSGTKGRVPSSSGASAGGGSEAPGGASSCEKFYGKPHDPNAAWIAFELMYPDSSPVVGEPYRVTLADGAVKRGKTDGHGLVCITGIPQGDATIEWLSEGTTADYVGTGGCDKTSGSSWSCRSQ